MVTAIFTFLMFARLLQAGYEDRMDKGEIFLPLPKHVCDSFLRNVTHCVAGAEFTQDALNDFEWNGQLFELYDSRMTDKYCKERFSSGNIEFSVDDVPQVNIRCCMCEIPEDTGCDHVIYDLCRTVFMSPTMEQYYGISGYNENVCFEDLL